MMANIGRAKQLLRDYTMIEPNKYTDETIHVANWLLGSGETDKLIALARADAALVLKQAYREGLGGSSCAGGGAQQWACAA